MIHYRPLDPMGRPTVGENLVHGTVTLTLPGAGGGLEEHQLAVVEAERLATALTERHEFTFTDVVSGEQYEVAMSHSFDAAVGQRLRDASSAVHTYVTTHRPGATARLREGFAT